MTWLLALKELPWKLIGLCALGMAFVMMLAALRMSQAQNIKLKAQIEKCTDARKADRISYERAQREAKRLSDERLARTKAEQERITDETTRNLNARLERLRSELRAKASPSGGAAKGPGAGKAGPTPEGTVGEARVCLAPSELLRGAENEERHDRLIDWVLKQSQVDPNR